MKLKGEQLIPAPREVVWRALNDPEVLKASISGCQELIKTSDTEFTAKVTAKIGPVKARFAGDVVLSELNPLDSYVISGQGKGGAAGFAKGGAKVELSDKGGKTLLKYDVDAQVGGKLAQIGSRLVQSAAKKMADDFFSKFAVAVKQTQEVPDSKAPAKKAAKKSPARAPAKKVAAKKISAKKKPAETATLKQVASAAPEAIKPDSVQVSTKSAVAHPAQKSDTIAKQQGKATQSRKVLPRKNVTSATVSPTAVKTPAASDATSIPRTAKSRSLFWWVAGAVVLLWFIYFIRS